MDFTQKEKWRGNREEIRGERRKKKTGRDGRETDLMTLTSCEIWGKSLNLHYSQGPFSSDSYSQFCDD